jgi:hypothetical protein
MKNLILIGLLFYSLNSLAQVQAEPQKIIDEFFKLYKEKNSDAALDYVFGTNKWMNESKDQIDNVKFKLNSTLKQLGEYQGYDLITKKVVGEHLSLFTYMVRYDRQPLRFSLLFYKPNTQWRLHNFSYDDNIDEELGEASKAYRLKENLDY